MKKRLLVIISLSNSIRYLYRTGLLKNLQKFCEPVIVMTWHQQDFIQELKENGFEVHVIEPSVPTVEYQNLRRKIDIWFDHYRLQSPSKKIQENYLNRYRSSKHVFIKKISKQFNVFKFRFSNYAKKVFKEEEDLLNNDTNY